MSTVLNGPWKTGQAPRPPTPRRTHPLVLAVLVAACVALVAVVGYRMFPPSVASPYERPDVGEKTLIGGPRYFAGESIGRGTWRAEVRPDQVCGYREVSLGAIVSENTLSQPGTMTVIVDANTQYVDFSGPCWWHWQGPKR